MSSTVMAMGLTGLLLSVVSVTYVLSMRSFAFFQSSLALEQQSRQAADRITAELRHADEILAQSGGNMVFRVGTNQVTLAHDPARAELVRRQDGRARVLLGDCHSVRFQFFEKASTNSSYGYVPASTFTEARAVQVLWRCQRQILGKTVTVSERKTPLVFLRRSLL